MANDIVIVDTDINQFSIDITEERKVELLQQDGKYYIGVFEQTPRHCLIAVQQNGLALEKIPKSIQTEEICLAAVRQNGLAIEYVSKKLLTPKLCFEAVKQNGDAIRSIPSDFFSFELCEEAIAQNGAILKWIPQEYSTSNMFMKALKSNGLALETIAGNKRTKKMCEIAISSNPLAIQYVPKRFLSETFCLLAVKLDGRALEFIPDEKKTLEVCNEAVKCYPLSLKYVPDEKRTNEIVKNATVQEWRAFEYMPENMYSLENCKDFYNSVLDYIKSHKNKKFSDFRENMEAFLDRLLIISISGSMPKEVHRDKEIVSMERKIGIRGFVKKCYDKEKKQFVTEEKILYKDGEDGERTTIEQCLFEKFEDFYEYLNHNLEGANFSDYDFEGIDLKKYDFIGAYVDPNILIAQEIYDSTFFKNVMYASDEKVYSAPSLRNEIVEAQSILHELDMEDDINQKSRRIYYISDIHLNHKLIKEFPEHITQEVASFYIKKYVADIVSSVSKHSDDYLLISGDVSFNYDLLAIFYSELVKKWTASNIIVVLGNHELWDYTGNGQLTAHNLDLENLIKMYRKLFSELGITFLQNELFFLSKGQESLKEQAYIITEEQLNIIKPEQLRALCLRSSLVVLGGIGFSGYCKEFNANNGIYRNTISTLEEDIIQTKKFELVYNNVRSSLKEEHIIVLTHTPKSNWSTDEYVPKWIYVNGHTHRNEFCSNKKMTVYSDNQVGYYNKRMGLKCFYMRKNYDIFRYYKNGIYVITREEYLEFNRGMDIDVTYNRADKLYMLKRDGFYCFIHSDKSGKIYLLNGGKIKTLECQDLKYYYENMRFYSEVLKNSLCKYFNTLKKISSVIKEIGGSGTIHGCIVDINSLNHIYLNPFDGKITAYYALSITEKFVFSDIKSLLKENCRDLYEKYKCLKKNNKEYEMILSSNNNIVDTTDIVQFVEDTFMYRPSRIMRSLQYLMETNVIRIWKDEIVQKGKQAIMKENGVLTEQ